jgi:hypothetical protein
MLGFFADVNCPEAAPAPASQDSQVGAVNCAVAIQICGAVATAGARAPGAQEDAQVRTVYQTVASRSPASTGMSRNARLGPPDVARPTICPKSLMSHARSRYRSLSIWRSPLGEIEDLVSGPEDGPASAGAERVPHDVVFVVDPQRPATAAPSL